MSTLNQVYTLKEAVQFFHGLDVRALRRLFHKAVAQKQLQRELIPAKIFLSDAEIAILQGCLLCQGPEKPRVSTFEQPEPENEPTGSFSTDRANRARDALKAILQGPSKPSRSTSRGNIRHLDQSRRISSS